MLKFYAFLKLRSNVEFNLLLLSCFVISLSLTNTYAQAPCPDPGGGFQWGSLISESTQTLYPAGVPSGRSGTERSTAGYLDAEFSAGEVYDPTLITIRPELPVGTLGSAVLKFDRLSLGGSGSTATIKIYNGLDASGVPVITISQTNLASYLGTTVVYNGPVTVEFSKPTADGPDNVDIYIKYLTGDQVITSCQNQQVAVWTAFMQPDSYTFIDDYGDPYGGNIAPICVGYFDNDRKFVSSEVSMCIDYPRIAAAVAEWYYPGEVIFTKSPNTNHDIDRNGVYDDTDKLRIARLQYLLANAPKDIKSQQLDLQKAVWGVVNDQEFDVDLIAEAREAVTAIPSIGEPTVTITAPSAPAQIGQAVNFTVNFDIAGSHPRRLKLVIPSGITIGTVTGATYDGEFLNFAAGPGNATIPVISSTEQSANIQVVYAEENFWRITNLSVYNACVIAPLVQDFVGLSQGDNAQPYWETGAMWLAPEVCTINAVTDPDFATNLDAWSNTGGWTVSNGRATNSTSGNVSQVLSQSLSNVYVNSSGNIVVEFDYEAGNCSSCNGPESFGTTTFSFAGTPYVSFENPVGTTGNIVVTPQNGASVSTSSNSFAANTPVSVTVVIPWTGANPAIGEIAFTHSPEGGLDMSIIDNVRVGKSQLAPVASAGAVNMQCPASTADMTPKITSTTPSGYELVWYTTSDRSTPRYLTPATATPGTYYAFYYNVSEDCYTVASSVITVNECSLPVTLVKFEVKKLENSASLYWETTQETNASLFEIQRSHNATDWTPIADKNSKGESISLERYHYLDVLPLTNLNYYRLKMLDLDGTYTFSNIRSIRFDEGKGAIYPNPVAGKMVFIEDYKNANDAAIYDLAGRLVYRKSLKGEDGQWINVEDLSGGTYVLKINKKDLTTTIHRIVVVK